MSNADSCTTISENRKWFARFNDTWILNMEYNYNGLNRVAYLDTTDFAVSGISSEENGKQEIFTYLPTVFNRYDS